jgi:uncharacterized membrane-anchored protein
VTKLFSIPDNFPQRFRLHNEVHVRAPISLKPPVTSTFLALSLDKEEKKQELTLLAELCERYGVSPPTNDASHFSTTMDSFQFCWEQHAEFSTYSFYVQNNSANPFAKLALEYIHADWLNQLPGKIIVAAHASIVKKENSYVLSPELISELFSANPIVGAEVTGGAAHAYTDFKIHPDGFSRFLLVDDSLKPGQAGRLLQRLFEIEVYRVMALLAFPIAKQLAPELNKANIQLQTITAAMAQSDRDDGELLDELTSLAAGVENIISTHHYRFGAATAYYSLVEQRIEDLREVRIQGIQTIGEFMKRRLEPAISTCQSTSDRFSLLSKRINNAGQLLRTRVDITIERQNQALLTSMDARAKTQLRLQETVEGLSIVAITSYVVSLIGSITEAVNTAESINVNTSLVTGLSIPFVLIIVAIGVRRIHKKILTDDE